MDYADIDSALLAVGKKLESNVMDWEAWAAKADLLYSAGLYEIAIRCCDRSLKLNPNNVFVWNTKGNALNKLGRSDDAANCYIKAKELDPSLMV